MGRAIRVQEEIATSLKMKLTWLGKGTIRAAGEIEKVRQAGQKEVWACFCEFIYGQRNQVLFTERLPNGKCVRRFLPVEEKAIMSIINKAMLAGPSVAAEQATYTWDGKRAEFRTERVDEKKCPIKRGKYYTGDEEDKNVKDDIKLAKRMKVIALTRSRDSLESAYSRRMTKILGTPEEHDRIQRAYGE